MTATAQSAACDRCQATTTLPHLLKPVPRSFRLGKGRPKLLCPRCVMREQYYNLYLSYGCYAVIAIIGICAWCFKDMDLREKQELVEFGSAIASIIIAGPALIILHEFAHALAGWALGMRVFGISLGNGRRIARWRFGQFFLDVHALPSGGLCWVAPAEGAASRWRLALMVAAGPMLHLVITAIFAFSLARIPWNPWRFGFWPIVLWTNLTMLLVNLYPHDIQRDGQRIWNDGKSLLNLLRPKYDMTKWIAARYLLETGACLEMGQVQDARRLLESVRPLCRNTLPFVVTEMIILGSEENWATAFAIATGHLRDTKDPLVRASLTAWAAVAGVYCGADASQALANAEEAASVFPWDPIVQIVLSLVFLAQEKDDDARASLDRAGTIPVGWAPDAARAWAWIELCSRQADMPRERKWTRIAETLDPRGIFKMPAPPS